MTAPTYQLLTTLAPNLLPITAEAALHKLQAGEALRGYHVTGRLDLSTLTTDHYTYFPFPLTIEHCRIEDISGSGGYSFQQPVMLRHTHFVGAEFFFAYFLQGLTVEGCIFENYLDFQSGGHNKPGFPVQLRRNTFHGFVNFFDCWYEAGVEVSGNDFRQGTNLLGRSEGIPVTFDVPPLIQANLGRLDHHDEGPAQPA